MYLLYIYIYLSIVFLYVFLVFPRLQSVQDSIRFHLADRNRGELVRSGLSVAIVGAPNAGMIHRSQE